MDDEWLDNYDEDGGESLFSKELQNVDFFIGEKEITKEEAIKNPSVRFLYCIQTFMKAGRMRSMKNDFMIGLYFHMLIGAYFKDYVIIKGGGGADPRTPVLWIQNSGSGKSQMNKFCTDFSNRIGVKAVTPTEFSLAGMVGSFDRSKHESNVKYGLKRDGGTVTTSKGSTHAFQDPVIPGDFYNYELIFVDEGKILLQPSKYNEGVLSVVQPILDYPGHVRKKLSAAEPIEYACNTSLAVSTVDLSIDKHILSQGFFQRCLFYYRSISLAETTNMIVTVNNCMFDEEIYNKLLNDFGEIIMNHPTCACSRVKRKINTSKEAVKIFNECVIKWSSICQNKLYGELLKTFQTFLSRFNTFSYKIASHMAILNNHIDTNYEKETRYIIGEEEAEYAVKLMNRMFDNLINSLEFKMKPDEVYLQMVSTKIIVNMANKKSNTISKTDLISQIMRYSGKGISQSHKIYEKFLSYNYFVEEKVGAHVKLTPNAEMFNLSTR